MAGVWPVGDAAGAEPVRSPQAAWLGRKGSARTGISGGIVPAPSGRPRTDPGRVRTGRPCMLQFLFDTDHLTLFDHSDLMVWRHFVQKPLGSVGLSAVS